MSNHYTLTPADIQDLRGSIRGGRMADGCGGAIAAPFIVYSPTDDSYYLHAHGYVWCQHKRVDVVAAAMRAERVEQGWLARALAPGETCIETLLSVEERAAIARRKAAQAAAERHALATRSDLQSSSLDDFL